MADDGGDDNNPSRPLLSNFLRFPTFDDAHDGGMYSRHHERMRRFLVSKKKHYLVMMLVALDVMGLLADILIALIACDMGKKNEPWVGETRDGIQHAGLAFSCLFLLELILCVWAFGFGYFSDWFHIMDGLVIIASFVIDLLTHGILEEIASLVIVLRLWRFVKIVEELSVGASERMEEIEQQVELLEKENAELKDELRRFRPSDDVEGTRAFLQHTA